MDYNFVAPLPVILTSDDRSSEGDTPRRLVVIRYKNCQTENTIEKQLVGLPEVCGKVRKMAKSQLKHHY